MRSLKNSELECVPDLHQRRDITTPQGRPRVAPAAFSGPPTAHSSTTAVSVIGRRIEISGFHVDILKGGVPFQFIRNDGTVPVFLVIEGEDSATYQLASGLAGSRFWYYATG